MEDISDAKIIPYIVHWSKEIVLRIDMNERCQEDPDGI